MIPITVLLLSLLFILLACLFIASRSVTSGKGYLPDKSVEDSLKALEPVEDQGVISLGCGRKERRDGNIVLHLKGTPYEMGFQHGRLLQKEIARGVVPVSARPASAIQTDSIAC